MPSLSAEKDGEDVSDEETLSYGGRRRVKSDNDEICHIHSTWQSRVSENAVPAHPSERRDLLWGRAMNLCAELCHDGNE
jgi:hypothetical protein